MSVMTIISDPKSKTRREYLTAAMCMVFSCFFYGVLTVAQNEAFLKPLWAAGFMTFFLFLPTWIRFVSNMITIKHRTIKFMLRWGLLIMSIILGIVSVASDKVAFVDTIYGIQFTYKDSLISRTVAVFLFVVSITVFTSHILWWREAKMERHRRQQRLFVVLTLMFAPMGYIVDFFIPAFTDIPVTPLVPMVLFPAALQLFISMRINRTLNITVKNVSDYIFRSVMLPTFVLDSENMISLENQAVNDLFGKSLLKKNISEVLLLHGEAPEQSLFDSNITSRDITVESQHGTKICEMMLMVENDKYGDALCKIIILSDITESEYMIKAMRKTSKKLKSALKQANAASKAKSDFLSNMSHEMRTPMNAIIGMTTVGEMAETIEGKNRALHKIRDASELLLGVINDVLDMAKIEANKLELDAAPFNFNHMIKSVLTVVTHQAKEKHQHLSVNVDERIPQVIIGDQQRLAQVLTNIVANAVKFTPEDGYISLDATLDEETDSQCRLRMEVTDTGIGISPEQQKKLFLAFEQANTGVNREYEGTGLGLVISKHIIELMGGEIGVESLFGSGARFFFTIKVLRCDDSCTETFNYNKTNKLQEIASAYGEFKGVRILLAEDIEVNREIIISLLEGTGAIIDCVENGQQALDKIAESRDMYDLVLMDVQMPKMDGLEATRLIRALPDEDIAALPIIAITANVFKEDIDACIAAGMNDHLSKPLNVNMIISKLRTYIGKR